MAVVDEIYVLLEESKKMTAIDEASCILHTEYYFLTRDSLSPSSQLRAHSRTLPIIILADD